jgi:carbamoylphosphate synthase large subunit
MNVIFLSPGFPSEMADFVRALSEVGANVIGIGDQPQANLPDKARQALAAYYEVSFSEPVAMVETAMRIAERVRVDRVESLWEPLMLLAARMREELGVAGMSVLETVPFRDKEAMKQVLDGAGVRTPRHYRARSVAEVRQGLDLVGFPAIVKPISGAGSADTYRVNDRAEADQILPALRPIDEVSVEEYVEAEEFTFDTISAGGSIAFYNICWYRPRPLIGKQNEWISQQTVVMRDPDADFLAGGRQMGHRVLEAMGFRSGFTHMEWYLRSDGEAVFGEIGARPPGGRTVDAMNFASDVDLFRWWAEAVVHGRVTGSLERKYNCATIFKRAIGEGLIQAYAGLDRLLAEFGEHVVALELNPIGAPRRDWRQQLIGDGMVVVRHPDLQTCLQIADRFGTDLRIYAG